jgi:hypothetical protein
MPQANEGSTKKQWPNSLVFLETPYIFEHSTGQDSSHHGQAHDFTDQSVWISNIKSPMFWHHPNRYPGE